jgi:hypothetical protein
VIFSVSRPSAWVAVPSRKVAVLRSAMKDQQRVIPIAPLVPLPRCGSHVKTTRRYARSELEDRRAALEDLDGG